VVSASTTANAMAGIAARTRQLAGGVMPARGALVADSANAGFISASRNVLALSNLSAGSFSSAFATAAATFGGTDLRSCVTGAAASVMIFMMICWAEPPLCGGCPASIS